MCNKNKTFNLCYMSALRDKDGNVFKDGKGRVKLFSGFPGINITLKPNPKCDKGMPEYILCIEPGFTIIPGLGFQEEAEKDEPK